MKERETMSETGYSSLEEAVARHLDGHTDPEEIATGIVGVYASNGSFGHTRVAIKMAIQRERSEITRLRSIIKDLMEAIEPFANGLAYIERMGPAMQEQYFSSIACTGKFGENDLRCALAAKTKAEDVMKEKTYAG
jgi:hypothetical protein